MKNLNFITIKSVIIFAFILFISIPTVTFGKNYSHINSYNRTIQNARIRALKKQIRQSRLKESESTAETDHSTNPYKRQKEIQKIAYNILNSNEIPYRMTFSYSRVYKDANAYTNMGYRNITITKGLLDEIEYKDELAFVLGHEIAHAVDSQKGPLNGFFYRPMTKIIKRKIETRCDLRSVDYLVKAGYNPIAGIIILNKIASQPRFDWYLSHPAGTKRLAAVYFYISKNYPEYLENNELVKDESYQNFLLTSKDEINKLETKYSNNLPEKFMKPE